ncbi:MAG: ribosome maturation factor RimP [Bdellovibrionales bacterium]|nr:ribosome maturation factor RimP [Bdellovibrionales bacterium]
MSTNWDQLEERVKEVASRENCFLYDLQVSGAGNNRVVRIFIDKDEEGGVTIDDCSRVSRSLDLLLDVEDLVPGGSYTLEVSSPGLERHLRHHWHFQRAVGEEVSLQLNSGLGTLCPELVDKEGKRKKLTARVISSNEDRVVVTMDRKGEALEIPIPYDQIQKARVVFDYGKHFNKKKPKG